MFVKRLKPNTYDVFIGNGWDKWARVVRRGNDLQQIGGSYELDRRAFNHLKVRLAR